MRTGDIVEHKTKGIGDSGYSHDSLYFFVKECRMKLPAGEWIDAIMYDEAGTDRTFVREKNDFYNKFKEYGSKD